jgi:hypothetical protein
MVNSTASIIIRPIAAFNHGDTFVFSSWVCTADGAGSFQRYLTMTPDSKTGPVTLPEFVTNPLIKKFGEFSFYNQTDDYEIRSDSNTNSTSPWIKSCEPAPEPSCGTVLLHEHFPYGLCNSSRAHAKALAACRAGKEIASEYSLDSNTVPDYNSDSFYEFDFGLDPIESESEPNTTEEPLSGPAAGLVITSTTTGRFVHWPDRKPANLIDNDSRCVAYLEILPFQEGTPLAPNEDKHTPTKVATTYSSLCTPNREVFMAAGTLELQKTNPIATSTTSRTTRNQLTHLPTRLPKTRTLGVTVTESELIDANISGKVSPSGISMRTKIKSLTGCTLPLSNALCLSPQ